MKHAEEKRKNEFDRDNIKIEGHRGTWYVIDDSVFRNEKVYLLEHEEYGDEASHLIINGDLKILIESNNGFDDLEYLMNDQELEAKRITTGKANKHTSNERER